MENCYAYANDLLDKPNELKECLLELKDEKT